MILCKRGCDEEVKEGNDYIQGHGRRGVEYWKRQQEPQLCECGCGEYAESGNRFIIYHHVRGKDYHKQQERQLCECGCGELANPDRKFINGHQYKKAEPLKGENHPKYKPEIDVWVDENTNKHLCKCGCGEYIIIRKDHYNIGIPKYIAGHYIKAHNPMSIPGTKDKISKSNTGKERTIKMRKHASVMTIKYFGDIINREKASAKAQGIPYDEWEEFAQNSPYCPKFDEFCRESNREKYDRMCFLTGLPESENITSTGKQQHLSVHHVDMDKMQGCDGKRWKLVPLCLKWHKIAHTELWIARITWLLNNVWNKNIGIINDT